MSATLPTGMPPAARPADRRTFVVPVRPALVRSSEGRKLAGVASGVATHLGLPVRAVRITFFATAFVYGAGAMMYALLWAFVPADHEAGPGGSGGPGGGGRSGAPGAPAGTGGAVGSVPAGRWRLRTDLLAGLFLVAAGVLLTASRTGWDVNPGLTLPVLIVAAGAVIAYAQFDEVERARWLARTGAGTRAAVLRLALGVALVVLGILLLVVQQPDVALLTQTLLAAIAVLTGVAVVLAPWGVRIWRDLDAERAVRAREAERADIAAHLHDSVLQTLALIQRRSTDGAEVARLARAQERDLRGYLYGGSSTDAGTVAGRVAALAAEAEDRYGVVIDVITVGDRPVGERTEPLLAALREAVANAARHAGSAVQVYVEFGPQGVEAYVRDRGAGFDLGSVAEDRHGVRESIIGRMERHGGSARVLSTPGEGTEVRLLMPDLEEEP